MLGPLATNAEPHSYDLCAEHAARLTAPRGWEVVRLAPDFIEVGPSKDDLLALADAVREAGRPRLAARPVPAAVERAGRLAPAADLAESSAPRRGHLRILRADEG